MSLTPSQSTTRLAGGGTADAGGSLPADGNLSGSGSDPSSRPQWIKNPWIDLLIGCGAWSLPLLVLFFYMGQQNFLAVTLTFYVLSVFCNQPHYMATIYRAYGTRQDFRKYRFFTVYVTVFVVFTAILAHWLPALLPLLFTLYITWSPWHYTGQNYGISMMFLRRNGGRPQPLERHLLFCGYLASYLVWFLSMHSMVDSQPYTISLGIPSGLADFLTLLCVTAFLLCTSIALARIAGQIGWKRMTGALVLVSTQFLWFVAAGVLRLVEGTSIPPIYYSVGVLAFMHCAQYLWITGYYTRRETEAGTRGRNREWRPMRYYGILVLGGLALFLPGPYLVSLVFKQDFMVSYLIFVSLINLHHFILDGAIWKLRDGRIARLLLGTPEKHGAAPAGSPESAVGKAPGPREHAAPAHHHDHHLETPPLLGAAGKWLFGNTWSGRTVRVTAVGALLALGFADQLQYFWTQSRPAMDRLARAMFLNPTDTRIYLQRASLFQEQGRIQPAIEQLREASRINPHQPLVHKNLAALLINHGQAEQAEAILERLEGIYSQDADVQRMRGSIARMRKEPEKAARFYRKALKLKPAEHRAALALADMRYDQGQADKAAEAYQRYLTILEENRILKKLPEQEAREVRDNAARAALTRGELLQALGAPPREIRATYRAAVEHARARGNQAALSLAATQLAAAFENTGETDKALVWTLQALRAGHRSDDPFLEGVAWFNLAHRLNSQGNTLRELVDAAAAADAAVRILGPKSNEGRQAARLRSGILQRLPQNVAQDVDLPAIAQEILRTLQNQ
jgi:tetratricopeptide (TPR) repeat protein